MMNEPAHQLEYRTTPSPEPRPIRVISILSVTPLILSAAAYFVLCAIAVQRTTSYIPYVYWPLIRESWIVPVALFTVWARVGWKAYSGLICYALATALIRSSSVISPATGQGWMVPYHGVDPIETLMNLVEYAPLHLLEAAGVFFLIRVLRKPHDELQFSRQIGVRALVTLMIITAVTASPALYHRWEVAPAQAIGVARANADWAAGTATLLDLDANDSWTFGVVSFDSTFDHGTGLRIKAMTGSTDFEAFEQAAYDQEVRQLNATSARPSWAIRFLPDGAVASVLSSTDLKKVTVFPYKINAAVTLRSANIIDGNDDTGFCYGSASPLLPVFVGDYPPDPDVHFVRFGNERVSVCTPVGIIESAQK